MPHGQQRNACACLPDQRKPVIDLLKAFLQLAVALLCSLSAGAMASQRILNVGYYEFAPAIYTDAHGTARGELPTLRNVACAGSKDRDLIQIQQQPATDPSFNLLPDGPSTGGEA